MKTCSKCKVPKSEECFYQTTLRSGPHAGEFRIMSRCKQCKKDDGKVTERTCTRCATLKPATDFRRNGPAICLICLRTVPDFKVCTCCKISKPALDFGRQTRGFKSLNSWCRRCVADRTLQLRNASPETHRARYNAWRIKHPEKAKQATARWIAANASRVTLVARARKNVRLKTDPSFKIKHSLGCRLRKILGRTSSKKCAATLSLLGCSVEQLRAHLQSKFMPGMTWANYGPVWHIDHIKPCAKFDLTDPEQQKICFHWTNLQPLFAIDNIRKSDKYENRQNTH